MGEIHVHSFVSLDGVIDAPVWTFEYGFHPKMCEAIGRDRSLERHPPRAGDLRAVRARVVDAHRRGRPGRAALRPER